MSQGPYKRDGETVYATEPIEDRPPEEDDSDEPKYRDRDWLYHQYHVLKKSGMEIAEEFEVSSSAIYTWMEKHGIDTRPTKEAYSMGERKTAPWRKEEWLRKQYVDKGKSTSRIADEYDVSPFTILTWLDEHGIEKRGSGQKSPTFYSDRDHTSEEWLRKQYIDKGNTLHEIAETAGVSHHTIRHHMDRHGIERREMSSAQLKRWAQENSISEDQAVESPPSRNDSVEVSRGSHSYTGPEGGIDSTWSDISDRTAGNSWCPYRDEEWLREQYCDKERSATDIAEECGVSGSTIYWWMDAHEIDRRTRLETNVQDTELSPDTSYRDREWLYDHYCEQEMTGYEIGELCGVSSATIYDWLERHDIDKRPSRSEPRRDN